MNKEQVLTQDRLKEVLSYDELTGVFTRKIRTANAIKVGDIAGCINGDGYIQISIDGILYRGHRLAWLFIYGEWPKNQIDHENQIRHNNWISNLREATNQENSKNAKLSSRNTSGVTGVYWHTQNNKWRTEIKNNGKRIYLGCFNTIEEAAVIRKAAELRFGYHKNHGKTQSQIGEVK